MDPVVTRADLDDYRDVAVPDCIGPGVRLLFVGINPSLWTGATGAHFAHPGNRFYPALHGAGILDRVIRPSQGMRADDERHLIERGVGITNLVNRATARADEVTSEELRDGARRLEQVVARLAPRVVAVAGITAYRTAFAARRAARGRQPHGIGGAQLWVVPNPSGLNAHETIESLAAAYRTVAVASGIVTPTPPPLP